jgi:hypothetical protein
MSSTSGWRVIREQSGNGRHLRDGNYSLSRPGSWWSAEKVTLRTNEYGPEAGSLGRCPRGSEVLLGRMTPDAFLCRPDDLLLTL